MGIPKWKTKNLLGIESLSKIEIRKVLSLAKKLKHESPENQSYLAGKRIVNLFMEPSTRTRIAFELAAKTLHADVISIAEKSSSLTKGETLRDTALNIQALGADAIVLRHSSPGSPLLLSRIIDVPIINAGDGTHEHPSQALLDAFSLQEKFGELVGKRIAIVGDVLHSRVALSNIFALQLQGANITVSGPNTLIPKYLKDLGVKIEDDFDKALKWCDAANMLRLQNERMSESFFPSVREYKQYYGLTKKRLDKLNKDIVIMHPGPINRGVEITSEVADSKNSIILDQVENGVAIRMAVIYLLAKKNINH